MDLLSLGCYYLFNRDWIWLLIGFIMICTKKYRMFGLVMIVAVVLQATVVSAVKDVVARPRPYITYDVDALINNLNSYSFPSGHTSAAFCAATVVTAFRRNLAVPMFVLAAFIGLTRMYMYAHYPTDVLVGAIVGIVCALFVIFILLRMDPRTVFVDHGRPDENQE